jgi:L-ascorbate metabolism protein UlaG (beta-lactamase superfamily)
MECMARQEKTNIRYIGGPTAWIEFCGLRFLTDPAFDAQGEEYTTGPVTLRKLSDPAARADELGTIDVVLLSHDQHADNLDRAGRKSLAMAGTVLTTKEGAERLGGNAVGLVPWQTIRLPAPAEGSLLVTATPARHGPVGCEARSGPVIGFAIRKADGEDTLYFSGDTVWYEGVAEVARWFRVTTAVLNMGAARVEAAGPAPLTMTAEDGVRVAQAMPDATIVPLHFEGWAHFSESRQQIQATFRKYGLEDRLLWAEHWAQ